MTTMHHLTDVHGSAALMIYVGWQWHNFFMPWCRASTAILLCLSK